MPAPNPRVALFATCLGDQFFADACADTVRLLRHFGATVDFPAHQTCCGQPAHNSGHAGDAARMIEHTCATFSDAEYIVLPSGSCAGMMRSHYPAIAGETGASTAGRTYELTQFLTEILKVESVGSGLAGKRVAYHHGCHALRELGVEDEPVRLLRACGAEIVAWEADRECCGFGGLFSAKMPEVSAGMADRKLDTLPAADVVTSTDGGCLMQLSTRAARRRVGPPFEHIARLLWQGVGQ